MPRRKHAADLPPSSDSESDSASNANANANLGSNPIVNSLERLGKPLPKLVAFDLDYTLWPLWVDTHVDPPLKRRGDAINKVVDRDGQPLSFFPHVPPILFYLRRHGVKIAAASRTSAPSAARQALNGLVLFDEGATSEEVTKPSPRRSQSSRERTLVKSIALFDFMEIYPGSKMTHFRKIREASGVEYEDMVFFDDEHRNSEVGKLGVHFVLVSHQGTDLGTFERGICEWRAKRAARAGSGSGSGSGSEQDPVEVLEGKM